jgi:streptogramin lyase
MWNGVSCASPTWCMAVGVDILHFEEGGYPGQRRALAARWNGTGWTEGSPPETPEHGWLSSVSCVSSAACMAIENGVQNGGSGDWNVGRSFISWTGSEWQTRSLTPEGRLLEVSCVSALTCSAVGRRNGLSFAAGIGIPRAEASAPTEVKARSATLNGTVNPGGEDTTYRFEYGPTSAYGVAVPVSGAQAGSAWANQHAAQAITGLHRGKSYHFRLVATSEAGSAYSADSIFKTPRPPRNVSAPVLSAGTPAQGVSVEASSGQSISATGQNVPLRTSDGAWSAETSEGPVSYAYQWNTCNSAGEACTPIGGASGSSYAPLAGDVGKTLRAEVTATNEGGSESATSDPSGVVKAAGELTEYALPAASKPNAIARGPDGDMWFAELGRDRIGNSTILGSIMHFALPGGSQPQGVAAGPDGRLWFTESNANRIGNMTMFGAVMEYTLPTKSKPSGIVAGPDGNLWFTEYGTDKVARITTEGAITEYRLPRKSGPNTITAGPDGNLWFTNYGRGRIGRITTGGAITEFRLRRRSKPDAITAGPDGNLWFTNYSASKVGSITTGGAITEYALPSGSAPDAIAAGPDGNLWFTDYGTSKVGMITTAGAITEYALPSGSAPDAIAVGQENNLWFTDYATSKLGTIVP